MASLTDVIVKDPDILSGTPVFRGTRVSLQALVDSTESGETLETAVPRLWEQSAGTSKKSRHQVWQVWRKFGGPCACGATFSYVVPLFVLSVFL
jgi:hypothetical protein